jgi:hypothetical protein
MLSFLYQIWISGMEKEPKSSFYREIVYIIRDAVGLFAQKLKNGTDKFPEIKKWYSQTPKS